MKENPVLGTNVHVGHFSFIGPEVSIGDGTYIGNNVTITGKVRIGRDNRILDGTRIGLEPQHAKYYWPSEIDVPKKKDGIYIGNGNIIRENVTIHQPYSNNITYIDDNNFLMANVHIAHDCVLDANIVIANNVALGGHCHVGSYANIGLNTCVHQFTRIGRHSMVGMGSVITKDIPPFHMVAGDREDAKVSLNVIGYGRNYSGELLLKDIKESRSSSYMKDNPYTTIYNEFKKGTKNGVYS